jgi:hypothetical protein
MPVTHFCCPADKPTAGEVHDPEFCVTRCSTQCYSPFLMTAIYGLNKRNYHVGRYVSATALSGCKRKLALERTVDYAEHYSNLYASFRGTITHTVIEEALGTRFESGRTLADMGFIAEFNMVIGFCLKGHGGFAIDPDADPDDLATYATITCPECDTLTVPAKEQLWIMLGGTLDGGAPVFDLRKFVEAETPVMLIDPDGTAYYKLSDIKTMKEYALINFVKGDPKNTLHPQIKDDYVKQARVYVYLAARCRVPEHLVRLGVKRIKFIRSDIQAFAMGDAPWTGGGTYRMRDNYRNPLKDYPMFEIDLGDEAWIEEYITTNAIPILESLILGNERAAVIEPEIGNKYGHHWLCNDYCAFAGTEECPNPSIEWDAIKNQGMSSEDAFVAAGTMPMVFREKYVVALTPEDTQNTDNFFRKSRGEETVILEKKRKPRALAKPKKEKVPVVPKRA